MKSRPARNHATPLRAASLTALLLAACAQVPPPGTPTAPEKPPQRDADAAPSAIYSLFHRGLTVPEGAVEVLRLRGEGNQIFRCDAQDAGFRWVYRLPEAQLHGADASVVAHHGANQSFEHVDGSRLVGEVADHVAAPDENALPWLLLRTRSFGAGALAGVRYVERIDTAGGLPPPRCEASQFNQVLRVPFAAEFVFFR